MQDETTRPSTTEGPPLPGLGIGPMIPSMSPREPRRASVRDIEQIIQSRIARGEYPVGHRLPSCERLGRQLGANKNTVSKAYQELARSSYIVSTPGRGTFVTRRPVGSWGVGNTANVWKLLSEAIDQAGALGLNADELGAFAAEAIRLHFNRLETRIGYVDCNRTEARELARDLSVSLSTAVEPLVVSDVGGSGTQEAYDLLAVNVAHLRPVERRLQRAGLNGRTEVVPVVALPAAETLTQVARLAAGTRLLILSDTEEVLHTLVGLARGVNPAIHVSQLLSSSSHFEDMVAGADAVLVTRTASRRLAMDLKVTSVIVASFKLDEQSISQVAGRRAALQQPRVDLEVNSR